MRLHGLEDEDREDAVFAEEYADYVRKLEGGLIPLPFELWLANKETI